MIRLLRYIVKALPLFLVLLCTGFGLPLFREVPPDAEGGTGVRAASIFRITLVLLLWRVRIYPTFLKKLGRCMQFIVEFLLAMFVVEYLQADFWIPLEAAVKKLLDKLMELTNFEYINNEWTVCFVVYGISVFFCISAMHGAKMIDLRETKYGPEPFVYAIIAAYRKFMELIRSLKTPDRRVNQRQRLKKGSDDGNGDRGHQKNVSWRKSNQKPIEWRKESDCDLTYDEDYSDFEMNCNE